MTTDTKKRPWVAQVYPDNRDEHSTLACEVRRWWLSSRLDLATFGRHVIDAGEGLIDAHGRMMSIGGNDQFEVIGYREATAEELATFAEMWRLGRERREREDRRRYDDALREIAKYEAKYGKPKPAAQVEGAR